MTREECLKLFGQKLAAPVLVEILGAEVVAKYKEQFADANEQQLVEAMAKLDEFEAQAGEIEKAGEEKMKADAEKLNRVIVEVEKKQLEEAKEAAGREDDQQLNSIESQLNKI